MNGCNYIEKFIKECKIFYGKNLISEESIIRRYLSFLSTQFEKEERKTSFALHTGSLCFDVIAIVMFTLESIAYNMSNNDDLIASLRVGNLVLYKNSRYRWRGTIEREGKIFFALEKDGRGKDGNNIIYSGYETNKHLIKPYYGTSKRTDSRGIRREQHARENFLEWLLEIPEREIPSELDISVVIIANRKKLSDISKNVSIVYDGNERISLLDIVPVAYYTSNGEEYSLGKNQTKAEAVLKIAGKISEARDLILNKQLNKTVGMLVMETEGITKNSSELIDLLSRKTLCFMHVMGPLRMELGQEVVELYDETDVFACTKEFLEENSTSIQCDNYLTRELDQQIKNIIKSNIHQTVIKTGGWDWKTYLDLRRKLDKVRKSTWDDRQEFVLSTFALINLFNSSVFSMRSLEEAISRQTFNVTIISPEQRVKQIIKLGNRSGELYATCKWVTDTIQNRYRELLNSNTKKEYLETYLKENYGYKIAVIVPKAYYVTLLNNIYTNMLFWRNVCCVTASKYDAKSCYDKILIVGNISNRKFNIMQCSASESVDILLYPCEEILLSNQKKKSAILMQRLNSKQGLCLAEVNVNKDLLEDQFDEIVEQEFSEVDQYIEKMNLYQLHQNVVASASSITGVVNTEVQAVGRFVTGEQILFSKYYNPIVYDPSSGTVSEVKVDQLESGDILIFVKRDNYTSNVVDFIYDELIIQNKLNEDVVNSTNMANYWKQILRTYKENGGYTYQEIASQMKVYGSSLQAVTIRQWLMEDSHIVGPRNEETMRQIALLTGDKKLSKNVHTCFEACRVVRHQRKEILNLIGRAITDKLTGNQPVQGSIFSIVYDNVENLSEAMELDTIFHLDEVINVPINLANRPITEMEVLV